MRRRDLLICTCLMPAAWPAAFAHEASLGDAARAAASMRDLALSWGDQPYGAVLWLDGRVVGEGPSRVVRDRNPDAHAERVAIADAQRRLGRHLLPGSVLVSTSRPCGACERAAAAAQIARMLHGDSLADAGVPRP